MGPQAWSRNFIKENKSWGPVTEAEYEISIQFVKFSCINLRLYENEQYFCANTRTIKKIPKFQWQGLNPIH